MEGERDYSDLVTFLQREAEGAIDTTLDDRRASNLASYRGDPYAGDNLLREDGRSTAMTRDVAEVVDRMVTGLLGTVLAGGKAVEVETEPEEVGGPPGPDGAPTTTTVDYGRQATAALQYQFFRTQPGYRVLHDACKAGLLEITGIVRTYPEPQRPTRETVIVPGVMVEDADGEPMLDGRRVIAAEPADDPEHEAREMAAAIDPLALPVNPDQRLHRVTVEIPRPPKVRDEAIPNEYFLVAPDAVDLDEAIYVGQRTPVTMSKLAAMGYDVERLREVWAGAQGADSVVETTRDADRSRSRQGVARTGANRELWFNEEYPLFDLDGDGIAERLYVARIGREVLAVMEVDEQPYSGWCPVPMQHRFAGEAMASKVDDIQRIRSVLLRAALDSTNLSNMPRVTVNDDNPHPDTIDDLLNVAPGGLIRYKGAVPPAPLALADTSGSSFQAMEMMSAERDGRTGVTRQSQGMNPDTTNKTATGIALLQANADQIELYVCRNYAEGVVSPMFAKRYRLMRAFNPPFRMKIDGEYVTVDPSKWPADPDMVINVGLGTGTKEQRIGYLSQLLSIQQAIASSDMRIVDEETVYNSVSQFVEDSGVGSPNRFIRDPKKLGPPPQQPDPNAAKAQADAQTQQAKDAQAHEQAMARLNLEAQESRARLAIDQERNSFDLQARRESAALDIDLKRDKATFEAQLAQQTADREYALELQRVEREAEARRRIEVGELPRNRPGGALDE